MFYNKKNEEGIYVHKGVKMNHICNLSKIHYSDLKRFFRPVIIRNKSWEKNIISDFNLGLNKLLTDLCCNHKMDLDIVNNIILGDTYDIFDIKTVKKFYKYINFNAYYVNFLGKYSNATEILDFLLNKFGSKLKYSVLAIYNASGNGNVNILEWWKNSGLPLKYYSDAMDCASENGHVNVLEWWKNSGLPLKYDEFAIEIAEIASKNGHVHVLEWWKNSGLPLKILKQDLTCD